jgi:ubiquinone/menaquinone biosynthesis C-methylase UbiE
MNLEDAEKILDRTRKNYDSFADSFAQTRRHLWPEMKPLAAGCFKKGDRVLDIGCGNGRFCQFFKEQGAEYSGIDNSRNLIAIARKNFPEANFAVADALGLPFKENVFDLAVSFAVIHHIPSKYLRLKFFNEARRVLKPGGRLIATAWDLRPLSMARAKQWKRLKSFLKSQIGIALGREPLDWGDFYIPWQNKYRRYHHVFTLRELKKLASDAGFEIEKTGIASFGAKEGNLYIVAKKVQN